MPRSRPEMLLLRSGPDLRLAKSPLVSWFRSSPIIDIGLWANFETETTLGF
jgi:hypothetical protein